MRIMGCDCNTKGIVAALIDTDDGTMISTIEDTQKLDFETRTAIVLPGFDELLAKMRPDVVYCEQAIYNKNIKTTLQIDAMVNMVRAACIHHLIPFMLVDNKSWKKDILGSGKATKEEYIKFAKLKWADLIITENDAAACCIAQYGVRRLG